MIAHDSSAAIDGMMPNSKDTAAAPACLIAAMYKVAATTELASTRTATVHAACGAFVSLEFIVLQAPDVAIAEAAVGVVLTTIVFVVGLKKTGGGDEK